MKLSREEVQFIISAKSFLENESFIMKITNVIGKPVDYIQKKLPEKIGNKIDKIVKKSLNKSLEIAIKTTNSKSSNDFIIDLKKTKSSKIIHNALTGASGAIGGTFGIVGVIIELPITTSLIMRNIVSIGNQFGFKSSDPQFPFHCLSIFTLGSQRNPNDDQLDSSYYALRASLEVSIRKGAEFLAANSAKIVLDNVKKGTAPEILNFIAKVAGYFEITVTEKMLAESLPIVGAVSGLVINVAFTNYFGNAARYHFGLLNLEKKYGKDVIEKIYFQENKVA